MMLPRRDARFRQAARTVIRDAVTQPLGSLRVGAFLGALLICSQTLLVTGIAFAVDTEARIRATVAAGETVVSALRSYRREHGVFPSTLDRLIPRYLAHLPAPAYGSSEWEYETDLLDQPATDERLAIRLDGLTDPATATDSVGTRQVALSVRLDRRDPATRFRRHSDGCWRLPEFPKCW
jgi:hypothetical protein